MYNPFCLQNFVQYLSVKEDSMKKNERIRLKQKYIFTYYKMDKKYKIEMRIMDFELVDKKEERNITKISRRRQFHADMLIFDHNFEYIYNSNRTFPGKIEHIVTSVKTL